MPPFPWYQRNPNSNNPKSTLGPRIVAEIQQLLRQSKQEEPWSGMEPALAKHWPSISNGSLSLELHSNAAESAGKGQREFVRECIMDEMFAELVFVWQGRPVAPIPVSMLTDPLGKCPEGNASVFKALRLGADFF
ncbi:hypothetical protein BKA70DRAFT_1236608 [Coprinopsis sp. MPI-PUGE-AT-0042]|nr:hypothetical protein BKA70DRAFT_1236608 [Coprinopsis sp. MPI-PUGE-AT-0042]